LALVERVVAMAARVGVDDFFVVTGYEAEQVDAFVADLALRRRLCVTTHRNDSWPAGTAPRSWRCASSWRGSSFS